MVIIAMGTVWFGYLLSFWGVQTLRDTYPPKGPSLLDLAIPGHYTKQYPPGTTKTPPGGPYVTPGWPGGYSGPGYTGPVK